MPEGCEVVVLADTALDVVAALEGVVDALGAPAATAPATGSRPERPTGALDTWDARRGDRRAAP